MIAKPARQIALTPLTIVLHGVERAVLRIIQNGLVRVDKRIAYVLLYRSFGCSLKVFPIRMAFGVFHSGLNIQVLHIQRVVLDELAAGLDHVAQAVPEIHRGCFNHSRKDNKRGSDSRSF